MVSINKEETEERVVVAVGGKFLLTCRKDDVRVGKEGKDGEQECFASPPFE